MRLYWFVFIFVVSILAPLSCTGQDRIELGYQTTKRGIVWYRNGLPTHQPTWRLSRDTNAVMWRDTFTSLRYDWSYKLDVWETKGVSTSTLPPLPTQTSGSATIDNRSAFWRPANNILHRYDYNQTAWVPIGDWFYLSSAPANVAAGGSNGAAVYTTSLWQDSDDQTVYYWDGDSWEPFAGGNGEVVVIDLVSEFATYPTSEGEELIVWRDANRGGVFVSTPTGAANGGTIFAGTGATKWRRLVHDSRLNVKWWGAVGDGSTDDTSPLQAVCNYVGNNDAHLYTPAGTYITSSTVTLDSFASVVVSGDGPNLSIWKRADNTTATLNRVLRIDGESGAAITVQNMGFDGNSQNQDAPDPVTEFQQYHNLYLIPTGDHGFSQILLSNINSYNPLGDGIGINSSSADGVGEVNISNVYETDRLYTRSSITITTNFDAVNVSNFEGPVIEVEPNGFSGAYKYAVNIANSYFSSEIDLNLLNAHDEGVNGTLNLTNVRGKLTKFNIQEFDIKADNLHIETTDPFRMAYGSVYMSNSYIKADSLFSSTALLTQAAANPTDLAVFDNVIFDKHSSATISVAYYDDDNAFGTNTERIKFQNCRFLQGTKTAEIRSGRFEWINCYHTFADTSSACITFGGSANASGVTNEVLIRDNYLPELSYLYSPPIAGNEVSVRISGGNAREGRHIKWTRFDKINAPKGAGVQINIAENSIYHQDDRTQLSAGGLPITGHWVIGDQLLYANPDTYGYMGVVCDTSGRADGTSMTGATAGAKFKKFGFILNITPYDASATNEAWTIDADDADTELITTQTVKFEGAGGATTDYDPGTNTLVITAGGSGDGNGIYGDGTAGSGDDNLPTGGSTVTTAGYPLSFTTNTSSGTVRTILNMSTPYSTDDAFTEWLKGTSPSDSLKIYNYDQQSWIDALGGNLNIQSDRVLSLNADSINVATVETKTKTSAIVGITPGGVIKKMVGGSADDVIKWDGSNWVIGAQTGSGGGVTGTGTANYVTYWTGTSTISADADFQFDGAKVGIGGAPVSSIGLYVGGSNPVVRVDGTIISRGTGSNFTASTSTPHIRLWNTAASTGDTWYIGSEDDGELSITSSNLGAIQARFTALGDIQLINAVNQTVDAAPPSAPSDGVSTYTTELAGAQNTAWIDENGQVWETMASDASAKWARWSASGNGTAVSTWAINNSGSGTPTTVNIASTSLFTSMRRLQYQTAASGSSVAGTRHNSLSFWRGNAAGLGGFYFVCRFGFSVANTTNKQAFIGFRNSSSAIAGNTNPSSLTNIIGFGIDATQTTLRFFVNDGSGTATATNLGANFPTNTNSSDMYEVRIFAAPNAGTVYYWAKNLSTGNTTSGSTSSDLPSSTTFLCPHIWLGNGSDATAVGIDVVQYSILTNY